MLKLHFDCGAGVSGDMTVGAFLDLGVPFDYLETELAKLGISDEYTISAHKVMKLGVDATKFDVTLHEHHHDHSHHGRNWADIRALISESGLSDAVKKTSLGIFEIVAEAEGTVHGKPAAEVHFHEVGAVDSIVDIVAVAVCVDYLRPDTVTCTPLTEGCGTVDCAHGTLSVPVPAVTEIARMCGVPMRFNEVQAELVTPTGIAICAYLTRAFSPPEGTVRIKAVGRGAGSRELSGMANVLRILLMEMEGAEAEECVLAETNIDDMTGEMFGFVMEQLQAAGALDVFFTPIFMKKNRPAYMLSVLCTAARARAVTEVIFQQTTSIGVRYRSVVRRVMDRRSYTVETPYGEIAVKESTYGDVVKAVPEFESVRRASLDCGVSYIDVYRSAVENLEERK